MKEQKAVRDFSFKRNKLFSIIINMVFLIFSIQAFGNAVEDNIICVGPPNAAGEAASEAGTNPCNLYASGAERAVNVAATAATLATNGATTSISIKPDIVTPAVQ